MGCGQSRARSSAVIKKHITSYTEFFEELEKGRKLVVYEDVVLDVTQFVPTHPGGPDLLLPLVGKH